MASLAGKTAFVTVASRSIGRASALALAASGARVLVHDGRGATEAAGVVQQIRDAGGRAEALAAPRVDGGSTFGWWFGACAPTACTTLP